MWVIINNATVGYRLAILICLNLDSDEAALMAFFPNIRILTAFSCLWLACLLSTGCNTSQSANSAVNAAAEDVRSASRLNDREQQSDRENLHEVLRNIVNRTANDYVTSSSCRDCHAKEYETWHASYHRTMTQEANSTTIRGQFDGEMRTVAGYLCQPYTENGKYFITLPHPQWVAQELKAGRDPRQSAQPPPLTFSVDRVIGSHHQQVYLTSGQDGSFQTIPLVWDIAEKQWITRGASFMTKADVSLYHMSKLWNNGCIFCHNTGPSPGLKQVGGSAGGASFTWNSTVKELGIACEACHGPGKNHAELQRELAKVKSDPDKQLDAASVHQLIVNPSKLSKERAVLVCARCHGKMIAKAEFDRACLVDGDFFDVRDENYPKRYDHPTLDGAAQFDESKQGKYFWPDGTPRTTALEYQGVLLSACYQRGEMTCASCHGMHGTEANDQLLFGDSAGFSNAHQNQACTNCHKEFSEPAALLAHTHHQSESGGSLCYNCHMPFQAYSLLKRVRSHRISNPNSLTTAEHGVPNACNQCHVEKSLQWTHQTLADWTGKNLHALPGSNHNVSLVVAHALSGHALQRALAIEQLGDVSNFDKSGTEWRARILIVGLEDDYATVRQLAIRALHKLDGFSELKFDAIAPDDLRKAQVDSALQIWNGKASDSIRTRLATLLGDPNGDCEQLIGQIASQRKNANIFVLE